MASKKARPAARKAASPKTASKKTAPTKKSTAAAAKKPKPAPKGKAPVAPKGKPAPAAARPAPAAKPVPPARPGKQPRGKAAQGSPMPEPRVSAPPRRGDGWTGPLPDKPMPRAGRLPQEVAPLTKREMEQVLTVGTRGVAGEGGLKGRLVVYQQMPYLEVIGRDKRELWFLLQGPDQEVFPAYVDHKISVSGLIKRFHPNGGSVDVRKYSARKPDDGPEEAEAPPAEEAVKLRLLSPGEVETIANPGMSVGVKGVATLRGKLELSGDEYFLVVSNAGTRQQVTFTLEGKATRGLKRYVGEIAVATGVVEKQTAWGGRIEADVCEPRAPEFPPVSRDNLDVASLEIASGTSSPKEVEARLNNGLLIRLAEKQGHVWAIEPQTAKRVSLREVHMLTTSNGAVREFFFTPRNPGQHEVEFFLGKLHNPMQPVRQFKVLVTVKSPEVSA